MNQFLINKLQKSKKAQATTEYTVFMIFIVITIITVGVILRNKIKSFIDKNVNLQRIFNPKAMHTKSLPPK